MISPLKAAIAVAWLSVLAVFLLTVTVYTIVLGILALDSDQLYQYLRIGGVVVGVVLTVWSLVTVHEMYEEIK